MISYKKETEKKLVSGQTCVLLIPNAVVTCDDSGDICVVKQIQVPIQSPPSESSRPERAVITGTSVSFSTSESSEESIEILQNPTKSELDENGQKVHVILPVTAEEPQVC